jgi:hypothetical protein
MNKAIEAAEIDELLKVEIGRNTHELKRPDVGLPQQENAQSEKSADDLGMLLRLLTERSTSEIENLIDELHRLRKKVQTDGDRIEREIARHSELSHGVMQLTTIVADDVKRLPNPTP